MKIWKPHDIPYSNFVKSLPKGINDQSSLFELLSYIRVARTSAEADFVAQLLMLLPDTATLDKYGNIILKIGDSTALALFSCHVDMISFEQNKCRQSIAILDNFYLRSADGNQLGADDGAGIWLMLNMIEAKIPGLYIFHRDEEIGGYGSQHIRRSEPEILTGIKFALAFDRGNTNSIVTHMRFKRCCSGHFAKILSNSLGMRHKLDDSGGFTDIAHYRDLIKECTNISVGYMNEHRISERLNYFYLRTLRNKLINLNWRLMNDAFQMV